MSKLDNNVPLPLQRGKNGRRLFLNEKERLEKQRKRSRERQRKRRQNPEELAKDAAKARDIAASKPIDKRRREWREKQANYSKRNKEQLAKYKREYNKTRSIQVRSANLKTKYGITVAQFNAMFLAQGSCCAICRTTVSGGRNWMVDHCHVLNKIRGILCHNCNIMIGNAKDDVSILNSAISYLSGGGI